MRYALPLFVLAIGCGQSPTPPAPREGLSITRFQIRDDDNVPASVVLTVTNNSRVAVQVDSIELTTARAAPVYDDDVALLVPSTFICRVVLLDDGEPLADGESIEVGPGATAELIAELHWQLFDDPPPMLMIVQGSFGITYRGDVLVKTDAAAFTLQSLPGSLELVVKDVVGDDFGDESKISAFLDQFSGVPSPGFTALRNRVLNADAD